MLWTPTRVALFVGFTNDTMDKETYEAWGHAMVIVSLIMTFIAVGLLFYLFYRFVTDMRHMHVHSLPSTSDG